MYTHTHHNFSVHFKHMRRANVHLVLLIFLAKTCSKPTLFLQCSQHFPADWCIPNIPTMVFCCIFPNMFLSFPLFSQYFPNLFLIFFLSCPRTPFQSFKNPPNLGDFQRIAEALEWTPWPDIFQASSPGRNRAKYWIL